MATDEFPVVGLGASAGGIGACREFFANVPPDSGIAYVVILHLSPEHDSQLAEVLQVSSRIPVTQVRERVRVEPNHVYVIPPNQSLSIQQGFLALSARTWIGERRAPVDFFFRTLADSHQSRAVCVVLSGTGANGSMGLKRVKEQGGICLVQDPEEAEYSDMPRNSLATGLVDQVLPVAAMPAAIIAYKDSLSRVRIPDEPGARADSDERALRDIFAQLRMRTGHDFSNYKRGTVLRRIERRIGVNQLADLPEYARVVGERSEEAQALLKDLLISVTNFFRDPRTFEALERRVIPTLFEGKRSEDQVRAWVAGCATGEEAYSVAMLLAEHASRVPAPPLIQVFATDLDEEAIATAREGFYTLNDTADVSPERLRRFFTQEGDGYRVRKELREMLLFARHNLIKDPPFSHLDLVTCRNLLIYLNRTAQQRLLEVMHFALSPGGYLFLGGSESVEGLGDLFIQLDKEARIFQSRPTGERVALAIPDLPIRTKEPRTLTDGVRVTRSRQRLPSADLHQRLLEQYAPPSIVINEEHEIVHLSPGAGRFLHIPGGEPSHNLLKAVRPEVRLELRAALYRAAQQRSPVEVRDLTVSIDDKPLVLNLHVRPALGEGDPARGFFLVIFEERAEPAAMETAPRPSPVAGDVAVQLEEELLRVKAELRGTIEQHDSDAEELKASNEELALNEELRSSAEELENSKEELQSVNEELRTVNQELKIKVEEQAQAANDMQNLIDSTDIGTIFLDRSSRIQLFTPRARDIFNLIPADKGRPLADVSSLLLVHPDLHADIDRVLGRLERVEREVQTRGGRWHLMRVLPYRSGEDRIDGVVLTFLDITERKQAEESLRISEERLRHALDIETVGVLFFRPDGTITDTNDAFLSLSGYTRQDLSHDRVRREHLTPPEWRSHSAQAAEELLATGRMTPYEREYVCKDGSRCWALSAAARLSDDEAVEFLIDITDRKRAEEQLRQSESRLRLVLESIADYAILTMDAEGRLDGWNTGAERMFGYAAEEVTGEPLDRIFTADDRARGVAAEEMRLAREDGPSRDERWHVRKDGSLFFVSGTMSALRDGGGAVIGYVKIARDLTERKQWEDRLQRQHEELEARVDERTRALAEANLSLQEEVRVRRAGQERVRTLLTRLVSVQEEERRRIARDLHDHLGQQTTALRLKLESMNAVAEENADLRRRLEEILAFTAQLDRDLDFLTWELRPVALDHLGIVMTLGNFVNEWSKNYGVPAEFHTNGLDIRLAPEVETNLYRIAQEALNNIVKHAQATRANVLLEQRDARVVLIVEDDGTGFDPTEVPVPGQHERGMGLLGMRERAALVGGTLELETEPGKGTTVFVDVPMSLASGEAPLAR